LNPYHSYQQTLSLYMAVGASSDEEHVVHDPGQDPSIENELTEYIRATDPATEVIKARATQLLKVVSISV